MRANNSKSGFTLAELLIVVAIIAVLVAVAIPVFAGQLEKSREAVDLANAWAACLIETSHAEAALTYISFDSSSISRRAMAGNFGSSVSAHSTI